MQLRLRTRVTLLATFSVVAAVSVLLGILKWKDQRLSETMVTQVRALTLVHMEETVRDVWVRCHAANLVLQQTLETTVNDVRAVLEEGSGKLTWGGAEPLMVFMDSPDTPQTVNVRRILWEGMKVPYSRDLRPVTPLLRLLDTRENVDVSIYSRVNDAGNMVCLASTALEADGLRRTGRLFAAMPDDLVPDPCIARVLAGRTYLGPVYRHHGWVLRHCEPIRDERERIAGMVEVEIPINIPMAEIRQSILRARPAQGMYFWVVRGEGENRGRYLFAQVPGLEGNNIWDARTIDGRQLIQEIVIQTMRQPPGETSLFESVWRGPLDEEARSRLMVVSYFAPWDWVLGISIDEAEFSHAQANINEMTTDLFHQMALSGGILLLIVLAFSIWMGGVLVQPLERLVATATTIANGDLRAADALVRAQEPSGVLETDHLAVAFRRMVEILNTVVGQVQKAGMQVMTSGEGIASSARRLAQVTEEQAAATTQTAETAQQIFATAQNLSLTTGQASESVREVANLVGESRQGLAGMETDMQGVMANSTSIFQHLADINARTGNIGGIVTSIAKIADQSNLLSLNAAIEAEKAGEYGLGFAVVAREIRQLADQTAASTLHIERVVQDMTAAIRGGVQEMDHFVERVRQSITGVKEIGGRLERLIEQVHLLTPRLEEVFSTMKEQSAGAENIRSAMDQLTVLASTSRRSIQDFSTEVESLNGAVAVLRNEVSHFTTDTSHLA